MARSNTDRKAGARGRHKAARPIQSRHVGKRAPESRRPQNESPMATTRRPIDIEEPLVTRSDRPRDSGSFSDDDSFGGSER
jgi:hypothetical protein